jgi:hypothetical protein
MADINTPGSLLGASNTRYEIRDYTAVRNLLLTKTDTNQPAAYATLPTNSPFGKDKLVASLAQEKVLGITPAVPGYVGVYDGVVGTASEEELAPGGNTADWTKSMPANANQYYMIGSIEHELTEVMGRFAFDGTSAFGNNVGPSTRLWTCSATRRRGCGRLPTETQRTSRSITATISIIIGILIWRLAT